MPPSYTEPMQKIWLVICEKSDKSDDFELYSLQSWHCTRHERQAKHTAARIL